MCLIKVPDPSSSKVCLSSSSVCYRAAPRNVLIKRFGRDEQETGVLSVRSGHRDVVPIAEKNCGLLASEIALNGRPPLIRNTNLVSFDSVSNEIDEPPFSSTSRHVACLRCGLTSNGPLFSGDRPRGRIVYDLLSDYVSGYVELFRLGHLILRCKSIQSCIPGI